MFYDCNRFWLLLYYSMLLQKTSLNGKSWSLVLLTLCTKVGFSNVISFSPKNIHSDRPSSRWLRKFGIQTSKRTETCVSPSYTSPATTDGGMRKLVNDGCLYIRSKPYWYQSSPCWRIQTTSKSTLIAFRIDVLNQLAHLRSPANVDAAKEWRENYVEFKRKVARCVRKSQEELL